MARRYDLRATRPMSDIGWTIALAVVVTAAVGAVSHTLAVAIASLILAWWIVMRFVHAWARRTPRARR